MENEIILLIIKGGLQWLGGYVSVKLFKLILKKFVKSDIKFKVIGIKDDRTNTALNKVIYFVPSICSFFVLALIVWYNNPFNIIDLIFIVLSVTMIVMNIFMGILIEYLNELRIEIDNTSNGLFRLTGDLRDAKVELQSSASLAIDYSKEAKKIADEVKENSKKIKEEADRVESTVHYILKGGKTDLGGPMI